MANLRLSLEKWKMKIEYLIVEIEARKQEIAHSNQLSIIIN